jgi:hypothetical protein
MAARVLSERLRIPPWALGYRYLRSEGVEDAVRRLGHRSAAASFTPLDPPSAQSWPLPRNVPTREALDREVSPGQELSFYDVPETVIPASYIARLPDCRVILGPDPWGNEIFSIVTPGNRNLLLPGVGFLPNHRHPLRSGVTRRVRSATWVLHRYSRNHFHWMVNVLPRLLLASESAPLPPVVMLAPERMTRAMEHDVAVLGVDCEPWSGSMWEVDELTVIHAEATPSRLRRLRSRLRGAVGRRHRRVFISRAAAKWRRLANEDDVWEILRGFGYESVRMEDLPTERQYELMAESVAVVGVHGAGLANTSMCEDGTQVLEIADAGRAAPLYYSLACASGHDYWLVHGRPVGDAAPKYRDLAVDGDELRRSLEGIERRIRGAEAMSSPFLGDAG